MAQLLDRLDDRFALLTGGDRLAPGGTGRWRPRWSGATSCWARTSSGCSARCRCSRGRSRWRPPRRSPGRAPAPAVLHLVDCSLLVPPRAGPDGRPRYGMLETLRAYGAGLLAEAGEQDGAAAALAGYAVRVAEAGRGGDADHRAGRLAAARWLDAEDATMRQVLAWAMEQTCGRRCGWWPRWAGGGGCVAGWRASTRCCARPPGAPSRAATGGAPRSSGLAGRRCDAVICPQALQHSTALRDAAADRGPCRALVDGLTGRSAVIGQHGPVRRGGRDRPPRAGGGPASSGTRPGRRSP